MRSHLILAVGFFLAAVFPAHVYAREDQRLDSAWHFKLADDAHAMDSGFDDGGWQNVSLPHNWGWEEAQAGKDYFRGPGWYRRVLEVKSEAGKRYFLRFEAASLVADVYLNGKLLGEHRGGFGAFCFEITKELSTTGPNVLAVRVDNGKAADVAPLAGDFSVYGGLYRPVHLIVTGDEHFAMTDHGSMGVSLASNQCFGHGSDFGRDGGNCEQPPSKVPLKLVAKIVDAEGKVVLSNEQSISLAPRDTAPYLFKAVLANPHLWNGRKDPYLYRAIVELRTPNDVVVDSVEQPLGLRFYSVDPEKGFYLNGQPYHLHGADRHQDYMNKGWAISEADMEQDVALLKEIGATVVRCAHYQHSDYFYSLCDRAGILVWAEIPQVNIIRNTPEFEGTSRNQLLDLIRQSINHPSIFAWSLSNEIGGGSDDPHRELADLSALAHGEDPTRPTIQATMTSARPQMNKIPDLLGWNIYPGWYRGNKEDYGAELDSRRDTSRLGGFCVSEYGAGCQCFAA